MLRKALLGSGIVASLLYVGIDALAALRYPEYHSFSAQMVSELMAKGAPTEALVDPLFLLYDVLMMAFAASVWMSGRKRARITSGLLLAYGAIGLLGPTMFQMNVRGSGGEPTADVLHIAATAVLVSLIIASVAFGASLAGPRFRRYSWITLAVFVALGALMAPAGQALARGEPTPWVGLVERLEIGTFLSWVAVLAISLLRDGEAVRVSMPGHGHRPRLTSG